MDRGPHRWVAMLSYLPCCGARERANLLLRLQSQTACVKQTYLWSPTALNDHPPTDKDNRHSPTRMPYHFRTERWNRRILVPGGMMCVRWRCSSGVSCETGGYLRMTGFSWQLGGCGCHLVAKSQVRCLQNHNSVCVRAAQALRAATAAPAVTPGNEHVAKAPVLYCNTCACCSAVALQQSSLCNFVWKTTYVARKVLSTCSMTVPEVSYKADEFVK